MSDYYMDYLARGVGYDSYHDYLTSDHWLLFSRAMRRRKCFCCGSKENLQVHHTTYENLGEELPTDVITVCNFCHEKIHDMVKQKACLLRKAHYILIKERKKRVYGATKKKWVYWMKLCNSSLQEKPRDVAENLISRGYMLAGQLGIPTDKAIGCGLARRDRYGKICWNKKKYISMQTRDHKKMLRNRIASRQKKENDV